MRTAIPALALFLALGALAGCDKPAPAAGEPETLIGKAVKEATDEAREELATGNIDLSRDGKKTAQITPAGDLLIEGKAVPVDAAQRKLLLAYRARLTDVAEAGIGVGLQGADLAGKAVKAAIVGVFSGNTEDIEKNIEAEAKKIEVSAARICERLPAMLAAQDALAAALPEFRPYANMDLSDIDDCKDDTDAAVADASGAAADAAGAARDASDALQDAKDAVRDAKDAAREAKSAGMNAAEEAEAAGAAQSAANKQ